MFISVKIPPTPPTGDSTLPGTQTEVPTTTNTNATPFTLATITDKFMSRDVSKNAPNVNTQNLLIYSYYYSGEAKIKMYKVQLPSKGSYVIVDGLVSGYKIKLEWTTDNKLKASILDSSGNASYFTNTSQGIKILYADPYQ